LLDRITLCQTREVNVADGDRLHLKANRKLKSGGRVTNGELVTVKSVQSDGGIKLTDGRILDKSFREFLPGYALLLFLYNTGARVSEVTILRHKDLLPGPAVNLHGKGGKERVCPLWPETLAAIISQLPSNKADPEQPVFRNARGQSLSRHGVYYILGRHATSLHRADPRFPNKIWPHLLRHSCAVALLQAGVDLITIRDQLGHASVATTGRYATSNLKLKRTALEAFWAAAGLATSRRKAWRPSPKLTQFLQSI
jgi:integrase